MHIELQLDFALLASYDKFVFQYLDTILGMLAPLCFKIALENLIFHWLILYGALNHQNLTKLLTKYLCIWLIITKI